MSICFGKEHTVSVMHTEVKAFDRIAGNVEKIFSGKDALKIKGAKK